MILADLAEPSPAQIYGFLSAFAAMAVLVLTVLKIMDHFKKKEGIPQPLTVIRAPIFAVKEETDAKFSHIESKIEAARLENKTDMNELFRLTRDIGGKVNYLEGATRTGRLSINPDRKP